MTLQVPCMPWFPRPSWWSRPPKATLLLASWNLEQFSISAASTDVAARKLANICSTLRELVEREGPAASVVVALQEVFDPAAVAFTAAYLTDKDAAVSGRVWHSCTSEPLGNNAERSAFLWSGPPALPRRQTDALCLAWCGCAPGAGATAAEAEEAAAGAGAGTRGASPSSSGPAQPTARLRSGAQAPLYAAPGTGFQLLSEADRQTVIRNGQEAPRDGCFLRSPFFGLFRVGYCNVLVVNVHLAAKAEAARSELSSLHQLASAIQAPNDRLFHRRFARMGACAGALFGSGRRSRGLMAVVGDFNCPVGRAVPAVQAYAAAAGAATTAADGCGADGAEDGPAEGRLAAGAGPAPPPGGNGANGRSWEAFQRNGWVNVLAAARNPNGNGPIATNWYAKQPKALDAICLQRDQLGGPTRGSPPGPGLVTGSGVCPQPRYIDAAAGAAGMYPNHLLCWVRLDLGPLQRAPGKVRGLQPAKFTVAGAGD